VATFRSDSAYSDGRHPDSVEFTNAREDARRRDFTLNGLFYDPISSQVFDYVHGREDLRKGVVRAIGNPRRRFDEDYLRLLRAVRFAAVLNFEIESATWEAIRESAAHIAYVAAERIFAELDKMVQSPGADRAVLLLRDSGLLGHIIPELAENVGVQQPAQFHPEGDVFMHTVKALSLLRNPSQVCAWATLLHDVGKVDTLTYADRIRFNNHARVGARKARRVLSRLRAPRNLIEKVYICIDNHMHFIDVQRMRLSNLKKFLARPTIDDELELHRADCLSSHGNCDNIDYLLKKRDEIGIEAMRPEPLVRGRDLLTLGFRPGPEFGEILDQVYELQLEERIGSKDEALTWIRQHYLPSTRDAR
jgi:poly(A) polymerase